MGYRIRFEGLQSIVDRADHILREEKSALGKALKTAAVVVESEAKRQVYAGRPEHLNADQGRLRASLTHYMEAGGLRAYVGSALIYAPVHEYGATIRAKNKPYLVFFIPGAEAMKAKRWGPRRAREEGAGQWVRVKQVTIPPRPYLGPALEAKRGAVREELEKVLSDLLAGN